METGDGEDVQILKAHVITLMDMPRSVEVAERCIESGARFKTKVEHFHAFTPKDKPEALMRERGFPFKDGRMWGNGSSNKTPFARRDCALACFLSHSAIWALAAKDTTPYLILEHDAVFVARIPGPDMFHGVCNIGHPSFGAYETPEDGMGPLVSKRYFPGAHGYVVTPRGAKDLLARARIETAPTDVFLHRLRFPWLTEFYPWPIVCDDTFSTIQLDAGCKAKHNEVTPC